MKCTVIIPVGPGHEGLSVKANQSVFNAWARGQGPFDYLHVCLVPDHQGLLGRSKARNRALNELDSDWFFLMDADDEMMPDAFSLVDFNHTATFGEIYLSDRNYRNNVWPVTRETLFEKGAKGTLSMGFFLRGDCEVRFDETMDRGEDFDFYMRLPDFVKIQKPLVSIGYDKPSARGPRGYKKIEWQEICDAVIDRYRDSHTA